MTKEQFLKLEGEIAVLGHKYNLKAGCIVFETLTGAEGVIRIGSSNNIDVLYELLKEIVTVGSSRKVKVHSTRFEGEEN